MPLVSIFAQAGVGRVGDVGVALGVERHAAGFVEGRVDCGTAVALRAIEADASPGARHQMDDAVRSDLANAAVAGDYVEAALRVQREGPGTEESGLQGGPAIARVSGLAGSGEGADGRHRERSYGCDCLRSRSHTSCPRHRIWLRQRG